MGNNAHFTRACVYVFSSVSLHMLCVCVCVCVYACVSFSIRVESDRSGRRDLTVSPSCRTMKNRLILSQVSIFLCIYVYKYIHIYIFIYIYIYIPFSIYINIYKPSPTVACVYYSPFSRSHIFPHHPHVCFGVLYPLLPPVSLLFLPILLVSPLLSFFFYSFDASPRSSTHIEHGTTHTRIIIVPKVQLKRLLVYIYYNRGLRGGAHVTSVCVSVMYIFILYDNSFL